MFQRHQNIVRDSDNYGKPQVGGAVHVRRKTFAFNTSGIASGITLFYLPAGAEIVDQELIVQTAFDAGDTNTLDFGTTGALTRYAAALAAGSAARVTAGFAVGQFGPAGALTARTPYTVRYNQAGTAAAAGAGLVIVKFWMPARGA